MSITEQYDDRDVCVNCGSTRLIGAPDCTSCGDCTDKCAACGASQHDCKK